MNFLKRLGFCLFFFFLLAFGFEVFVPGASFSRNLMIPKAEARVGRPLTPISFAGVARRTVRRCAAGIYYCY